MLKNPIYISIGEPPNFAIWVIFITDVQSFRNPWDLARGNYANDLSTPFGDHKVGVIGMKNIFRWIGGYFRKLFSDPIIHDLQKTWLGKAINTISFLMVIFFMALWITLYSLLQDKLSQSTVSSQMITAISCFSFFGGFIGSFLFGGWIGNGLRRVFWKILIRK